MASTTMKRLKRTIPQQWHRWATSAAAPRRSIPSLFVSMKSAELADRASSAAHAEFFIQQLADEGIALDKGTCHDILKALAIHPDPLLRGFILKHMQDRWHQLTDAGWHAIAVGQIKEMQLEQALETIDEMRRANVKPKAYLIDMLTYMLCDVKELDEALNIIKDRIRAGDESNIDTILWFYVFDAACELLHHETLSFVWNRRVDQRHLHPTAGQCLAVLQACARNADVKLATNVFRVLGSRNAAIESVHYELLMQTYLASDDIDAALTILCIMQEAGIPPTDRVTPPLQQAMIEVEEANTSLEGPETSEEPDTSQVTETGIHPRKPLAANSPSRALNAFATLKKLHRTGRTIPIAAFNAVLTATLRLHGLDEGITQYKQCHLICGKPNTTTFNALLRACRSAPPSPTVTAAASSHHTATGIASGTEADDTLLSAKEIAMFLVAEMVALGVEPTALTYDRLLLVCIGDNISNPSNLPATARQRADFDTAMRYYAEMRAAGLKPRAGTWEVLARRAVDVRDPRVWRLLDEPRRERFGYSGAVERVREYLHATSDLVEPQRPDPRKDKETKLGEKEAWTW